MPRFTVRIELHEGDPDDYSTLHGAMERVGFSRYVESDAGVKYFLPWAEYSGEGNLTLDQVLESAKHAAAMTRRRYAVLVTESKGRRWFGLTKAT